MKCWKLILVFDDIPTYLRVFRVTLDPFALRNPGYQRRAVLPTKYKIIDLDELFKSLESRPVA